MITSGKPLFQRLRRLAVQAAGSRSLGVTALIVSCFLTLPVAGYPMTPDGELCRSRVKAR
jgi:hypothetical protein